MVDLARLRRVLAAFKPETVPGGEGLRQAAVAVVVAERAGGVEVLFILRAEDERDPWSGHVSFPGGRVDDGDRSPLAAAVRETKEEVGLDLAQLAEPLGALSEVDAIGRGRRVGMVIRPFVFALHTDASLTVNHEVQETLWVPLAFFLDRANRSELTWRRAGVPIPLPCYRYQGRVIWGLTLHMLDELLRLVG